MRNVDTIIGNKKFGLVGKALKHSFSESYFKEHYSDVYGLPAEYKNYELGELGDFRKFMALRQLDGVNVTIPYKEQVVPFLDRLSAEAEAIGAVNCVKAVRNGDSTILTGYNTDALAFEETILPWLEKQNHREALILGTGGAAKAVSHALRKNGLETTFVSRSKKTRDTITYSELNATTLHDNTLIVNATPLGTLGFPEDIHAIDFSLLNPRHLCYDLVYNPEKTTFLQLTEKQGCTTKNGMEMLHLQALMSWKIWNSSEI